jgi:hypothetical protein
MCNYLLAYLMSEAFIQAEYMREEREPFDLNDQANIGKKNKMQLQVAEEVYRQQQIQAGEDSGEVPKDKRDALVFQNAAKFRELTLDPKVVQFSKDGDWEGAKAYLVKKLK